MKSVRKADRFSRVALATSYTRVNDISAEVQKDRNKFEHLTAEDGVTFDADSDEIVSNDLLDKVNAIAEALGITFKADGDRLVIDSNGYSEHVHEYSDATINDTEDGTGSSTDTTRDTAGVK